MPKNTKDKLLNSALSLIDKKQFHEISTKEIAQQSGMAEVTLFRHFKSKDTILEILAEKFFKLMVGFNSENIKNENDFRMELINYFNKSISDNFLHRRLFKLFLYIGCYRKDMFLKYANVYERQIAGPIERTVEYGKNHWGYQNVDTEIVVKLLINSIGFFNIVQNVFLHREVQPYDFKKVINIAIDNFFKTLKK